MSHENAEIVKTFNQLFEKGDRDEWRRREARETGSLVRCGTSAGMASS